MYKIKRFSKAEDKRESRRRRNAALTGIGVAGLGVSDIIGDAISRDTLISSERLKKSVNDFKSMIKSHGSEQQGFYDKWKNVSLEDLMKDKSKFGEMSEDLKNSIANSKNKYLESTKKNEAAYEDAVRKINKEFRGTAAKKAALYGLGAGAAASGIYYLDKKYRKDTLPI